MMRISDILPEAYLIFEGRMRTVEGVTAAAGLESIG